MGPGGGQKRLVRLDDLPGGLLIHIGGYLRKSESLRVVRCCKKNEGLRRILDSIEVVTIEGGWVGGCCSLSLIIIYSYLPLSLMDISNFTYACSVPHEILYFFGLCVAIYQFIGGLSVPPYMKVMYLGYIPIYLSLLINRRTSKQVFTVVCSCTSGSPSKQVYQYMYTRYGKYERIDEMQAAALSQCSGLKALIIKKLSRATSIEPLLRLNHNSIRSKLALGLDGWM